MIYKTKTPINKGWSIDKKYCVTDENDNKYLLRVSPAHMYEGRKSQFNLMKKVSDLYVPISKPISIELIDNEVHFIIEWIDGDDAENTIPTLPLEKQYTYGLKAGAYLKSIHSIQAPDHILDWEPRFNKKMSAKIDSYLSSTHKYEKGQLFIDYINANRDLLKNRPQTYQHGDYHIGNMMISNDQIYIIDFDRDDYGDPWEEFNRIVWSAQTSPAFATGIIDGYFNGNIPQDFWKLLLLYISSNTLSSITWAEQYGLDQIEVMINQADEILSWYGEMTKVVPGWYGGMGNTTLNIGEK